MPSKRAHFDQIRMHVKITLGLSLWFSFIFSVSFANIFSLTHRWFDISGPVMGKYNIIYAFDIRNQAIYRNSLKGNHMLLVDKEAEHSKYIACDLHFSSAPTSLIS